MTNACNSGSKKHFRRLYRNDVLRVAWDIAFDSICKVLKAKYEDVCEDTIETFRKWSENFQ